MQQKEVVATPKALKKALEHEKTPELAAKLAAEAIERDTVGGSGESTFATKTGRTGGVKCLERGERQRSMSCFALLSAAFEQPRRTAKLAEALSTLKGFNG